MKMIKSNYNQTTLTTSRFKILTSNKVDEIAGDAVATKTKKQTVWGVKVFKGMKSFLKKIFI